MASPSVAAPSALTFSYARAIQQPALRIWGGKDANRPEAQRALLHRAICNRAARRGQYSSILKPTSGEAGRYRQLPPESGCSCSIFDTGRRFRRASLRSVRRRAIGLPVFIGLPAFEAKHFEVDPRR